MAQKEITDKEIISYLNEELDEQKTSLIDTLIKKDKDLKSRVRSFQELDNIINKAAAKEYPIPEDFHQIVRNIVSDKEFNQQESLIKRFSIWLDELSPFRLISGSVFGGVAIAGFCVMSFITFNNYELIKSGDKNNRDIALSVNQNLEPLVFRGEKELINKNIPSSWIIKENIAFALDYYSGEKNINSNENIEVNVGDELVFNIIPFENKVVDVDYITDTDKRINIYSNLSLEKGKTFTSTLLEISDPVGLDKIINLENGNLILEKNILVKK